MESFGLCNVVDDVGEDGYRVGSTLVPTFKIGLHPFTKDLSWSTIYKIRNSSIPETEFMS